MNLEQIENSTVKSAIETLQNNKLKEWYQHFTNDVIFTDDGRTLDFKSFFDNAFDKKEKFLTIDKIENSCKNITGDFYAGQWGTFKVYFYFHLEKDKIVRLDIGQVSKKLS